MDFRVIPILEKMAAIYAISNKQERFEKYINLLQGNSSEQLELPIMGYNPMGKEHVIDYVNKLLSMKTESLMENAIADLNLPKLSSHLITVVCNLADDLRGAWTNRYSTDYTSKFDIKPLLKRGFCCPYFWTSETPSENLIQKRSQAYFLRSLYCLNNKHPQSLGECIDQERFVISKMQYNIKTQRIDKMQKQEIHDFIETNKNNADYNVKFYFFYGDKVCKSLGYPSFGLSIKSGWQYLVN